MLPTSSAGRPHLPERTWGDLEVSPPALPWGEPGAVIGFLLLRKPDQRTLLSFDASVPPPNKRQISLLSPLFGSVSAPMLIPLGLLPRGSVVSGQPAR